jgi:hypothetical protein
MTLVSMRGPPEHRPASDYVDPLDPSISISA